MKEEITERNTKSQILLAYRNAMKEIEKKNQEDKSLLKTRKEAAEMTKRVESKTGASIINSLAEVKLSVNTALDKVSKELLENQKGLEEQRKTIENLKAEIQEIHEIEVNADSLKALLMAQKEQKEAFQQEMKGRKEFLDKEIQSQKEDWQKEQEIRKAETKEYDENIKKKRAREEEEYI